MQADKVSAGMLNVYKNMKDHLAAFQERRRATITFDYFDFNLYESLVNYLTYDYVQRRKSEVIDGKKEQIDNGAKPFRFRGRDAEGDPFNFPGTGLAWSSHSPPQRTGGNAALPPSGMGCQRWPARSSQTVVYSVSRTVEICPPWRCSPDLYQDNIKQSH